MATNHTSVLSRGIHGLRRVKPTPADLAVEFSKSQDRAKTEGSPTSTYTGGQTASAMLLRVWLKSPWDDYISVLPPTRYTESALAYRKGLYFSKAMIRVFPTHECVGILQQLSDVRHPNIAKIHDVYCYDGRLFLAVEYLELSLPELDFQTFQLEEWEIATIIAEVLKGAAYLLCRGISCKDLCMANVRLSIYGDVKIILDVKQYEQNSSVQKPKLSNALLDVPFLAEIVEDMMLPRYHLSEDNGAWSCEALEFLSCCLSGSVEMLLSHPFLAQATSTIKIAARVRFTTELLRGRAVLS